ncbi:MAG: hypothetical protein KGZ65_04410 [Sphingomonadales bacterium]|nr:hypothetical protein [Sphingomonadaceae bacterium]MBS3930457.1 hypothetical protein [Sphingomonadales bacterium]
MNRLLKALAWLGLRAPAALAFLLLPIILHAADGTTGLLDVAKANVAAVGMGLGGTVLFGISFMLAGRFVPGIVVGKLRKVFEEAKASPWWREKPHRAKFLHAAVVFLEAEVPDAGEGQEVYDAFGAWANAHARVGGMPLGSAAQWAALARKGGDAIDLQLNAEIVEIAAIVPQTQSDVPPAA